MAILGFAITIPFGLAAVAFLVGMGLMGILKRGAE